LLGHDAEEFDLQFLFWPLVNHYNTHDAEWLDTYTKRSQLSKTIIFYDLVNTGDYEHTKFCEFVSNFDHPHRVYLTVNQSPKLKLANVHIVPWDFMWNRYRSYYTETVPYNNLYLHHYSGPLAYQIPQLDFDRPKAKKFLSMTGREFSYRTNLYEFVKGFDDGYVSNRSRGITVEGQDIVGAFQPVPNAFYLDSYVSIYCESNFLRDDLIHITEKTFEPLIKGHIILPFGNPGTVARLVDMGFKMPKGVDYGFDSITDPQQRFTALTIEFQRLMAQDLPQLYKNNQEIFLHNQACINTIEYDTRVLTLYNV
jgi:hypothetical protein